MPKITQNTPGGGKPEVDATIGDAVNYASNNPPPINYIVQSVKWIVGFVAALFKPGAPKR